MTCDVLIQPQTESAYRAAVLGWPETEHPWLRFLGAWETDPSFDDLAARMAAYRRELDETSA